MDCTEAVSVGPKPWNEQKPDEVGGVRCSTRGATIRWNSESSSKANSVVYISLEGVGCVSVDCG